MIADPEGRTLSVREVAERAGVSQSAVRESLQRGDVPCVVVGSHFVVEMDQLVTYLRARHPGSA